MSLQVFAGGAQVALVACADGNAGVALHPMAIDAMPVDARTHLPVGLLHGGASVLLAETLASLAGWLCLDPELKQQSAGIEINANHLRAVTEGLVTGTARPIHLGRATQVWEIRIEDAQGRLTCISRMTAAVIGA
mgnify:CR=1 FL=1